MTEEIIIDCAFYKDGVCASPINKTCEYCKNIDVSKCYHKQLKRLEQENKELKELIGKTRYNRLEMYESFKTECNNYRSALEEIKNNFMCFRSCMIPFHVGNKENLPHNMADTIQNYCESIMNKINEVLK